MTKETKAAENKKVIKYPRRTLVNLYLSLLEFKNGGIDKEAFIKLILLRVKLKDIYDGFETIRKEVVDQTKPEDWKEGQDTKEWDKKYSSVIEAYLDEEIELGSDLKILTLEECADFLLHNTTVNSVHGDAVTKYLVK